VAISIEGLVSAFFKGVEQFLIDVYLDGQRGQTADERFQLVVHCLPFEMRGNSPSFGV
jgi:hypothetical protein